MGTRKSKQIIYGALYGGVVLAVFLGIYFWYVRPVPSCFDNVQNQSEQGVDCGGPCARVCIPSNIQRISTIGTVSVFPATSGHYTLLGQVANTNIAFAAQDFTYRFDLYDAAGTVVDSIHGTSFAYAGEVKYLVAPNVAVTTTVDHATLTAYNPSWTTAAALGVVPQFGIRETAANISSATISVSGELADRDISSFSNVLIIAVFYNPANVAMGASQTLIDHIAPNETQSFSVIYPATGNIDPSRTKFFAYALRL